MEGLPVRALVNPEMPWDGDEGFVTAASLTLVARGFAGYKVSLEHDVRVALARARGWGCGYCKETVAYFCN